MELDNTKVIAILGDINTGKTNLAFHLLREYKGTRKIYLLGYPKQVDDFSTLPCFTDIFQLTDSIIFMDEIHRFVKIYDKKTSQELLEMLTLFSHNNNTLIFTTQLSQFITKSVEAFIDTWCITQLREVQTLKNGSKPKRIVRDTVDPRCSRWSLSLKSGQYLEHSASNLTGMNRIKEFPFQGIGKDWRVDTLQSPSSKNLAKIPQKSGENVAKSSEEISATVQTQTQDETTRNTIRR